MCVNVRISGETKKRNPQLINIYFSNSFPITLGSLITQHTNKTLINVDTINISTYLVFRVQIVEKS